MLQNNSIHRLTDNILVKFSTRDDVKSFFKVKSEIELTSNHFIFNDLNEINKTVWDSGLYQHRLNKIHSNLPLHIPSNNELLRYYEGEIFVKQGFNWDNLFGLHLIIKSVKTNSILISKILTLQEFKAISEMVLLDNEYFVESVKFNIPEIKDELVCQITTVTYDDITNDTGLIINYPTNFTPLIDDKPLPDYIRVSAEYIDNSGFLNIGMITTENKTLEQSLLDYFGVKFSPIEIFYIINYGNVTYGHKSLKISNDVNVFNPIKIGLDLTEFETSLVTIKIECYVYVDTKLLKRSIQLNADLTVLNPYITQKFITPETIFPVEVKLENVINNTVIQTKETKKIVGIFQPIFAEFITGDLYIENKNVIFEKITSPAYLKIDKTDSDDEQIILSKSTIDNQYYFYLNELKPISKQTTYQLISTLNNTIIGSGNVLIKK